MRTRTYHSDVNAKTSFEADSETNANANHGDPDNKQHVPCHIGRGRCGGGLKIVRILTNDKWLFLQSHKICSILSTLVSIFSQSFYLFISLLLSLYLNNLSDTNHPKRRTYLNGDSRKVTHFMHLNSECCQSLKGNWVRGDSTEYVLPALSTGLPWKG